MKNTLLPAAGAVAGTAIAPGVGTVIGGQLGSMAGRMFGLELEGLSPEDQEFEVARRFVRFAGEASKQAATAPPTAPANQVVQAALKRAAQKHAPGLAAGVARGSRVNRSGTWKRLGDDSIVVRGV